LCARRYRFLAAPEQQYKHDYHDQQAEAAARVVTPPIAVRPCGQSAQEQHDQNDDEKQMVDIAIQAFTAMKTGNVGLTGATGSLLTHTLTELRYLTERSLPAIRLASATTTTTPR
jgi:hypothetical protein